MSGPPMTKRYQALKIGSRRGRRGGGGMDGKEGKTKNARRSKGSATSRGTVVCHSGDLSTAVDKGVVVGYVFNFNGCRLLLSGRFYLHSGPFLEKYVGS
ncbi:hypothetical protein CDAR_92941 [Caerostris darwini]|uniref:Uncharacterized protein n=1 Tax=Caerostris darwini TaxID=1538125 RepID=A0AAV4PLE6_9ARAC|nr:hypothetical protein CDAR_92941 [Caerostris darwini]